MTNAPLRFGAFLAPHHHLEGSPTLTLKRIVDLISHMDSLGFDEVYVGEHHSGGVEIVSCPEMLLAAAAMRTNRIRLGTGVVSVPYHHPLMVADRMVLLDQLTGGRAVFGVGPGANPTDAHTLGLEVDGLRPKLEEGLEAIYRLLYDEEPVTLSTDWFTMESARLNLSPVQWPRLETVVAAVRSPSGPRLAGRFGCGLLSLAATDEGGFDFLKDAWGIAEESASDWGQTINRKDWRLVTPMHLAESVEVAREQAKYGLAYQMRKISLGPFNVHGGVDVEEVLATADFDDLIDGMNASGEIVIGTPDMARSQIERLIRQSGGFGSVLVNVTGLANYADTRHSLELIADQVMPEFQNQQVRPRAEWDRMFQDRERVHTEFRHAQDVAIQRHQAEMQDRAGAATPSPNEHEAASR